MLQYASAYRSHATAGKLTCCWFMYGHSSKPCLLVLILAGTICLLVLLRGDEDTAKM